MRGTSAEETLWAKEAYERFSATYRDRFCAYRSGNGRFPEPLFKDAVQTCGQQIRYCGVGSHHQNAIVELRIKELTLGSWTLLLHATMLWPEAVITMWWPFSFKSACQRYNRLEIDGDGNMPEQKFSGVRFQIRPTDYHTWGCPVFILETPHQEGPTGLTKWEQRAITRVYI